MSQNKNESYIQEKVKKLLKGPPGYSLSEHKRREFIARLYDVTAERKSVRDNHVFRKPVYIAAMAAAMFVFAVCLDYLFIPVYPSVSNIKGDVKIYRHIKNEWTFVEGPKVTLYRNDIVKTFENGEADLIAPGMYHMRLKNGSEIKLASSSSRALPGAIKFELSKGKVFTHYNKSKKKPKEFNIETSQAVTTCLGTDFMVDASPASGRTWVGVLDGVVKVSGREALELSEVKLNTVYVNAGEKTTVYPGASPLKPARLMENELLEMEELYRIGTKPQVALLISTGPARVRELLSVTPLYISSEKPGILPEKIEKIAESFNKAVRERSKKKHIESIKQFEEIVASYPNPKYDVQFLLFIGAYYEYLDEHNKAIETFQKIITDYSASNLASIAQCAIGIIYEEKLNDPARAKIAYQKVISYYPRSPEVEEAAAGLERLTH